MKRKHMVAIVLALAMLFALDACGGDTQQQAETEENELKKVLPGIWEITSWDLITGGYLNVIENAYLVYTDEDIVFIMDGEVYTDNSYTWIDENTVHAVYKADTSYTVDWKHELQEDGTMIITDEENNLIYYVEKCPEGTDPYAVTQRETVVEEERSPIAAEELVGTWTIESYTVLGSTTQTQDWLFVFTEGDVQYIASGITMNDNTYEWTDEKVIHIVNKENGAAVDWELGLTADGTLAITDLTNGVSYACTRSEGEAPAPAPAEEPTEVVAFPQEDLPGAWSIKSYSFLGTVTPVSDQLFTFDESGMIYTVSGATAGEFTYEWTGDNTISIIGTAEGSTAAVWQLSYAEDGTLTISDLTNFLDYSCEKQA